MYEDFLRESKITLAASTYQRAERIVKEYEEYSLTTDSLLQYIEDKRAAGVSDTTLELVNLSVLRKLFTFLMYHGFSSDTMLSMIRITHEIKGNSTLQAYATHEEVAKILDNARGIQKKLIIALCYYGGLRISEALGLQWKDIRPDSFIVRNTKTKADRQVPILSPILKDLLRRYRETTQGALLFSNVTQNTIQVYFKRLVKRLGYPDLHLHSLRAGFVTAAFEKGIDMETIMTLTGHKQMANVQRYAHCTPAMMEKAKKIFSST